MASQTKKCSRCSQENQIDSKFCRFCGATFETGQQGYCPACRQVVQASQDGRCPNCGTKVTDLPLDNRTVQDLSSPNFQATVYQPTTDLASGNPAAVPPFPMQSATPVSTGPVSTGPLPAVIPLLPIKGEGVNWRFNAIFLDWILVAMVYAVFTGILPSLSGELRSFEGLEVDDISAVLGGMTLLALPVIWFLYFFISEGIFGATLGKALSNLRVIRKDGGKISWGQAAVRAFLGIFEDNIIAAICVWATPLNQRIADLLAGTLVVNRYKVQQVEFNPPAAAFTFHDYRRYEFKQISSITIYKFGLVRNMVIRGLNPQGGRLKIQIPKQFQKSQFAILEHELVTRMGIYIQEKIIWWRLLLILILVPFILLCLIGLLNPDLYQNIY
jgi:uncharacterized RDD family membrane protein YckC